MLILTRKIDQSIIINHDIEIKVLKVQGGQVHLGIEAPRSVSVYRHEIYQQVMDENKKAVQPTGVAGKLEQLEANLNSIKQLFFDRQVGGKQKEEEKGGGKNDKR